jgi:uncharacterized protein YqgC (DUF456 family)
MELLILGVVLVVGLMLVPLGLPGIWLIVGAVAVYNPITGTNAVSTGTIVGILVLATIAEVIEFTLAARYTRKYGGSRRAGWGAILGGMIGAVVGVPIPVIGSVIGAFVGSFAGALVAEWSRGTQTGPATRVATGALLGRVAATAAKIALGFVMAVWALAAAWQ